MATAYITMGQPVARNVFNGVSVRSEPLTTSGTSAQGALLAASGDIVQVFCATAVYASVVSTAVAATSVFCPGGVPTYFAIPEGARVALIDA